MDITRRELVRLGIAAGAAGWAGSVRAQEISRVVVIGGGFGGATCARYMKIWNPQLDVTLVDPAALFVACPMSNRVLGGTFNLREIARDYTNLIHDYKVKVVQAVATAIDPQKRLVVLNQGKSLPYDRLVVSPGVEFITDRIGGLDAALDSGAVLHAWRGGGAQVTQIRDRLAELRRGGVVAIHVPKAPFRCPPGPYERVSLMAHFLSRNNPTAKILLLDSNPDILSKRDLFLSVWRGRYGNIIDYVPNAELTAVSNNGRRLELASLGAMNVDLANIIPPQRAPALLRQAGLVAQNANWCPVDFLSYESTLVPRIHVLGDSIASAPGLPKSGHMANQGAKVCAAAIVARSIGVAAPAEPVIANTCYSFVSANEAMHVAGVYRYDAQKRTMAPVAGAGGLSSAPSVTEAVHAIGWVFNILHDSFGGTHTLRPLGNI